MPDQIMTIQEVAAYLKIKEKTAYRLVAEGKIPGFKVGGARGVSDVARSKAGLMNRAKAKGGPSKDDD